MADLQSLIVEADVSETNLEKVKVGQPCEIQLDALPGQVAAGNRALVFYFEATQLTSAFGATAGFAAIMVWMYWTSLTILIGAQVGRSTRDVLIDNRAREMVEGDI